MDNRATTEPDPSEGCEHEWVFPEWASPDSEASDSGWPQEVCAKCGMSLIRHIFTECP